MSKYTVRNGLVIPTQFAEADTYKSGERIMSNLTKRTGTVVEWPKGVPTVEGAVWVHWDDLLQCHAYRHQIHRY